ncbi:MAG: tyrosine-type recombinase/integrase [Alphaproteobacteria bacterium]|nr:tyrosine-type recombinase/integrase [Alphaproteobacteria bacterium]
MPKARLPENRGLPSRWRKKPSGYYYQVPPGQEAAWDGKKTFPLGKTISAAYATYAERIGAVEDSRTVGQLLDRYELEVVPTKAKSTQYLNLLYIKKLRAVFGHIRIVNRVVLLEPVDIYKYVDKRSKKTVNEEGKTRGGLSIAKREVAMFSDMFTKAVKWGAIKEHPFKGAIELDGEKPRTRYVENWEINEFMSLAPKRKKDPTRVVQAYMTLKIISSQRQQDLLSLKITDLKDDGIHITPLKTKNSSGKSIIIEWTPALRAAVDYALSVRPTKNSFYVFCNRRGQSYYDYTKHEPASGWKSIWSRYMDRVLEETKVTERFTEHDLRAKGASDIEDLEHARKLLSHTDAKITQRVYRRKPEKVKPAQ